MAYKKFIFHLCLRLVLIIVLACSAFYFGYVKNYPSTTLVLVLGLTLVFVEFISCVTRVYREIDQFFGSMVSGDYSFRFHEFRKKPTLHQWLNKIMDRMQSLSKERSIQNEMINQVISNIPTGIICFRNKKQCVLINENAKVLLGLGVMIDYEQLCKSHPALISAINKMKFGDQEIFDFENNSIPNKILMMTSTFNLSGEEYLMITLEKVSSMIEKKEMDSWKDMMRVLHHEIVNSITPIVSLSASLKASINSENLLKEREENLEALEAIYSRASNLIRFTSGYRKFAILQPSEKSLFQLMPCIQNVVYLMAQKNKLIKYSVKVDPDTNLNADQAQIEQVLTNIIINAQDAIEQQNSGHIEIEVAKVNDSIMITISDNGKGMDDTQLSKVFVPFFTTKSEGQGIGLSLSRQIIQQNGGSIYIKSKPANGTKVILRFKNIN